MRKTKEIFGRTSNILASLSILLSFLTLKTSPADALGSILVQQKTAAVTTPAGSETITFNSTSIRGDLIFVKMGVRQVIAGANIVTPTGWNLVTGPVSGNFKTWLIYKVSAGESSVTINFVGSPLNLTAGNYQFTELAFPGIFRAADNFTATQLSTANFTVPTDPQYCAIAVVWICVGSVCNFNSTGSWVEDMAQFGIGAMPITRAEGQLLLTQSGANPISSVDLGGAGSSQLSLAVVFTFPAAIFSGGF